LNFEEKPPTYTQYGTDLPGLAYMTVSKDDPFYNMNHPRRGKAIIFNFDHWVSLVLVWLTFTNANPGEDDVPMM
jgi:hypothetical protein